MPEIEIQFTGSYKFLDSDFDQDPPQLKEQVWEHLSREFEADFEAQYYELFASAKKIRNRRKAEAVFNDTSPFI